MKGFLFGVVTTLVVVIAVLYPQAQRPAVGYSEDIYTTSYLAPPPGPIFRFAMWLDSLFVNLPNKVVPPPFRALGTVLHGRHISALVGATVKLKVAEALRQKPLTLEELAEAIKPVHAPFLKRVLTTLIRIGFFQQLEDGRYANNKLSAVLCPDHPNSVLPAIQWAYIESFKQYDSLETVLRTGQVEPLEDWWTRINNNEEHRKIFADFMQATASLGNQAVVEDYNFCKYSRVVDMGGGTGGLLKPLLAQCPNTQGAIYELPAIAKDGKEKWTRDHPELLPRASFIAGDFLERAPEIKAGEAYVFRGVLHDWPDDKVSLILKNCLEQMKKSHDPKNTRLVLVELFPDQAPGAGIVAALMDIQMLLISGEERTVAKWDQLLTATGFKIVSVTQTRSVLVTLEAVPL